MRVCLSTNLVNTDRANVVLTLGNMNNTYKRNFMDIQSVYFGIG